MPGLPKKFVTGVKKNRASAEYRREKAIWLKEREQWGGWYICEECGRWTQEPELDHTERVGMGGRPSVLLDKSKWQLLCRDCHDRKDGGMKHDARESVQE